VIVQDAPGVAELDTATVTERDPLPPAASVSELSVTETQEEQLEGTVVVVEAMALLWLSGFVREYVM